MDALICPSLLSCDFAILADEAKKMKDCGADWLHMDVMDGHFVPNITIGAPVIKSLRKHTEAFLDCHMMVSEPARWIKDFKEAGASQYCFHMEATGDVEGVVKNIKESGMKVGVAIKPKTPTEEAIKKLQPCYKDVHNILVMTVEPGFGGQEFMADMMPKVKEMRAKFPDNNIQVDGGLDEKTVKQAAEAGANVIVAGSSIFKSKDPRQTILNLRETVKTFQAGK